MEIVVFHSDIARLVLAYLKNQRLEKASHIFCKTSPHLQQEYTAFKQGLQAYSFFPELEEIIREYVKITRKVEQVVAALPEILRPKFQHKKLSQKLNEFLDRSLPVIVSQCDGDVDTKDDCKTTNNSTASCNTVQSDKDNKAKKLSDRKRKRTTDSINTSNERSAKNETPKKRRRILEPFCFLTVTRQKERRNRPHSPDSSIDQIQSTENDEKNHDETSDSEGEFEDETEVSTDDEDIDNEEDNEDVCILDKPTKESTPRAKTAAPTLSEFSQAILDNPEFQQKLVENINQALQTSGCLTVGPLTESSNEVKASARKTRSSTSQAPKLEFIESEASLATSSQLLDQLVKDILANTEKDPTFDAIIQDVVGASTTKSLVPERSNVDGTILPAVESINGADNISTISTVPPTTPLLIRSIPSNVISNNSDPQALPSQLGNNSFGSLIDPNFSISKLIVLNSNDSAQKQSTDPTLGNTTADNLLNQLSSQSTPSVGGNELSTIDDQVYFDVNTGQLTLPLFLTNDGFLTNFPFLINNELITQQLQPDNIANLDSTRIEIPLPEPISFSADQLPPNSIIVGSTQKNEAAEGIQRTVCKLQKNVSVVPASLDSRMNVERATPSSNGIVNVKAFKSLSTPRKRASHVRTLTFSPRSSFVPGKTPLSTRRECVSRFQRVQTTMPAKLEQTMSSNVEKTMPEEPEKSTAPNPEVEKIKNDALPSSTKVASVAAIVIDTSANESSNSCSVPPLFAMEESSNQTVIKANLPKDPEIKPKKPEPKVKMVAETPKRKQLRKTAVRACKRVLSKSATEEEEEEVTAVTKQNEENSKNEESDLNSSKLSDKKTENESDLAEDIKQKKDRMMEEWVRMRTATNNDLDSRLREWNSKMMYTRPNQKCVKKLRKKRVKSLAATAAKKRANQSLMGDQNVSVEQDKAAETEAMTIKQTDTSGSGNVGSGDESQANEKQKTKLKKTGKTKCKAKDPNSSAEFNIKITTPQKATNSTVFDKKDATTKVKLDKVKQEETKENSIEVVDKTDQAKVLNSSAETSGSIPNNDNVAKPSAQPPSSQIHSESIEREKRTANIACLLETPFKAVISSNSLTASCVPPTPGVFGTSFETPISKLKPTTDDLHSHSFLFGSLTKSELETPLLSAITPGGFKFTPFGSKDATPRSATATEYSSGGGSYYRPDESDDLDRNIDKLLRDTTQKRTVNTPEKVEVKQSPTFEITSGTHVEKSKSLEIPGEKLKVEPIVLKRVKSFGSEAVDSAVDALANIDPHYTLAAGLPSDDDEASSSSSSSSEASSSSSCNSSSSGTSSSSSRTSSKSNNGKNSETVIESHNERQSLNVSLALDNLSEISSTEDDEWQKLAVSDGENSQLVDHDGEVRYPVRSWLTPSKAINTTTAAKTKTTTKTAAELPISNPIKVKLPLKGSQKRNKQLSELEEKRQRMKSKLKNDSEPKKRALQSSSTAQAQAATRRLQLSKEVKLKKMQQKQSPQQVQEKRLPDEDVTPCTLDVLTALNLSAKKQPTVGAKEALCLEVIPKLEPLGDIDDNAVSNVFESASALAKQTDKHVESKAFETTQTISLKTSVKPKQTTQKQRKCLQIEARPVVPSRGTKKRSLKKAPARSKVAASLMPSETAEAENIPEPTPKPSPIPKIKIKSSAGVNLNRPPTKTNYGTKSSNNNKDEHVSSEKTSKPLISRKFKTPVKKPGAKLLEKQAASPHKQQQVKQQKNTEPQRIDTVDEQVKTTTEQKVVTQRIEETENQESPTITPEKSPIVESAAVPTMEPSIRPPVPFPHSYTTQPVNEEDDISEDDDPLKYCTLTSYTEDDGKGHFVTLKYKGIDGEAPKQSNTVYDLSNFRMVIAFDEDEQHTLQVSEEYCLFESKPKQQQQKATKSQPTVRNIPKKRKLRVATTSTSDDSIESTSLSTNGIKSFSNISPTASSTPLSATTLTQKENNYNQTTSAKATNVVAASKEDKIKPLPVKSTTNSQEQEKLSSVPEKLMTSLAPSLNSAAAEKIHIEDIESILSHLHGT